MSILVFKQDTVIDNEATGANARELRQQNELSMDSVAAAMKVSKAFLSYLETGQRGWSETLAQSFEKAVAK